jgi:hypothetical protein
MTRLVYSECGKTRQWLFVMPFGTYRLTIDDIGWRFRRAREESTQEILTYLQPFTEPYSAIFMRLEADELREGVERISYAKEVVL